MSLPAPLRQAVRERAGHRCEYCRMKQSWEGYYSYHVEHVIAQQHRGPDLLKNLALSCRHCNWLKGPNLASIDPDGAQVVLLFQPRTQLWAEHFSMENGRIFGLTAVGRTTLFLLEMNAPHRVEIRLENLADW
ncbi:MAG: HNH endonuclease [Prosthecobacter sp.]|uniref:HNH endonuclease n=1 Tax=Prosthecobacter sp. TaxID=1965333 RepID=UPI003903892A